MPEFTLTREEGDETKTRGMLAFTGQTLRTLELPWRENKPDVSCIPAGRYRVVLAWSNRFQKIMPRILGVLGRDGILIHPGNIPANTDGCILVGTKDSPVGILNSKTAFYLFMDWLGNAAREGDVWITIS